MFSEKELSVFSAREVKNMFASVGDSSKHGYLFISCFLHMFTWPIARTYPSFKGLTFSQKYGEKSSLPGHHRGGLENTFFCLFLLHLNFLFLFFLLSQPLCSSWTLRMPTTLCLRHRPLLTSTIVRIFLEKQKKCAKTGRKNAYFLKKNTFLANGANWCADEHANCCLDRQSPIDVPVSGLTVLVKFKPSTPHSILRKKTSCFGCFILTA